MPKTSIADVVSEVKRIWDASSLKTSLPNGPYHTIKPAGNTVSFPYVVFKTLPANRVRRSNGSEYWEMSIQFEVRHRTPELALPHIASIGNIFDDKSTTLGTAGHILRFERSLEDGAQEDRSVYLAIIQFDILRRSPR